jgi:hypothetical protein
MGQGRPKHEMYGNGGESNEARATCRTRSYSILLIILLLLLGSDRLCDLVVRVLGYRSGGPDSIPGTTKN